MESTPEVAVAEARVTTRILDDAGWRDPRVGEDSTRLIAEGSSSVWVDILADPRAACDELRSFTSRCPQLDDVDPDRAARGGEYPPRYPPKAKAFQDCIFARAYWLGATESSHEIRAQEVHILAGETFVITLRYPSRTWDMVRLQKPAEEPEPKMSLGTTKVEKDAIALRRRLGLTETPRSRGNEEVASSFGLEVTIAILDQVIDSVFESLNAIRLVADDLEGTVVEGTDEGRITRGAGSEDIPKQTLNIRRLLRQVRWSFLPSDEISELRSGPFLGLSDPGIELQLEDLCREADRAVDTVRDVIQQVQHVVELSNALKTERLDQTIHVLTIGATVLLVPTLLAGVWGMNFDRIPGAGFRQGFWIALILLLALSVGAALLIGRYLGKGAHSRTRRNRR